MTTEQQLPEGWEYVPFNMFFNVVSISDKKISQKEYLDNGKYPVIDQGNLFIGGYSNDESLILKISSPVIVFGDHTKCFKYVSFPFVAGADGIKVLEPQNGIYPKYAYYYCLSIDLTDRGYSRHFAFLKKCQFLIVPIETQQAIVNKIESLFDEIDEGIGRLKTAARQIQQYRQSLLKNAFNGELTKEWRSKHADTLPSEKELLAQIQTAREQHHAQQLADWQAAVSQWEQNGKEGKKPSKPKALTQAVKFEENVTDLPSGWGVVKLGTFIQNIQAGKSFKCEEKPPINDEIGVAKVSAVTWGEYDENETKTCFDESRINPDFFIKTGDFLFSRANTIELVGACVIVKKINKTIMLSDKTLRIHFTNILEKYVLYYLRSSDGRKQIMDKSSGNQESMRNIGQERIKDIDIPICSPAEQTQIVAILESKLTACDQLAAELSKQLKQAELLKQAVLKAAFSGSILDK